MFEQWREQLAGVAVDDLGRRGLCDLLADTARLRSAVDAVEARAATALEALDDRGAGAATVLRSTGGCSQREADRRARRATTLKELPDAAEALAEGAISSEHVEALGRAVEATSPEEVADSGLVDQARRRPADLIARDARDWARRHQRIADVEARQKRQRAERRLVIFDNDDGMTVLHGEFDPVTGAQLRARVEAETNRLFHVDGGRDTASAARTPQQRSADAITNLLLGADRAGEPRDGGTGGPGAGRRPVDPMAPPATSGSCGGPVPVRNQMLVIATADPATGIPADGRLVDGTPVVGPDLERLACGSDLYGLLFAPDGEALWHGRRVRLATDAQWRALIARDGGCVICTASPSRCEAHHIVVWQPPGCGSTDIDNLVLLCSHHHHLAHDTGQRLTRLADGTWALEPP